MKRVLLYAVVFVILGGMAVGQLPLSDVPANHWAYEGVKYLLEAGILGGMPDGTFQGNTSSTRYQLAVALYRAIEYMKSSLPYLKADDVAGFLNQLQSMKSLVDSVAMTVETLGSRYNTLANQVESLRVNTQEVTTIRTTVSNLEGRINSVERDASSARSEVENMKSIVATLQSQTSNFDGKIRSLESELTTVKTSQTRTTQDVSELSSRVRSMENLLGGVNVLALQKEVSDMSRSVNDMRVELTGMRDNFAPIERQFSDVANRVGTVESSLSTVRLQVTNINAQMEKNTTSLQTVSADYEAFKSDILPRVSKNSSDIVNNTRQIQDLNLKMNAMYQDLEAQIQMPTIVSWVGVVAGAVGIGIGVYALLYAQEVAKMIDPE